MELRGARRKAEQEEAAAAAADASEAAADAARAQPQDAQAAEAPAIAPPPPPRRVEGEVPGAADTDDDHDDDEDPDQNPDLADTEELDEDHNETECGACGAGGELLCCEGCPAAFHAPCAGYASSSDVPDAPWLCWFCALQHLPSPRRGPGGVEVYVDSDDDDEKEEEDGGKNGEEDDDEETKKQKKAAALYDDAKPENGRGAGERYRRKFGPLAPLAGPFPAGRRLMLASDGGCVLYYDVEVIEGGGNHPDHLEVRTAWGRARASPLEPVERVPLTSARWWHGSCDLRRCWTREELRGLGWRPNARLFALADPAAALLRGEGGGRRRGSGRPRIDLAAPVRLLPAPQARAEDEDQEEEEEAKRQQAKRQKKQQAPRLSAQAEADLAIIVRRGEQGGSNKAAAAAAAAEPAAAAVTAAAAPPLLPAAAAADLLAGVPTDPCAVVEVRVPLRLLSPSTPAQQQQQQNQPPLVLSGWRRAAVVRRAPGASAAEGGARLLVRVEPSSSSSSSSSRHRRVNGKQQQSSKSSDALMWTPAGMRSGAQLLPLVRAAAEVAPSRGKPPPLALTPGARVEVRRTVPRGDGQDDDDLDDDDPSCFVDEWVPATVLYAPPEGGWLLVQSASAPHGDGAMWRVEHGGERDGGSDDNVRAAPAAATAPVATVPAGGGDGAAEPSSGQGRGFAAFASASEAVARAGGAA